MKIIVGLGNPGLKYKNTRHNIGFNVIDEIAKKHKCPIKKKAYGGAYGIAKIFGDQVLLFKPLTYMNLSGEAVASVCASKLEDRENLLVVTDDADLDLGVLRIKRKGSSGGHNGLKSIIENMGSEFARLRIGVGRSEFDAELASHVLSLFSRKDSGTLNQTMEKAVECVETWLKTGIKEAMNQFN